MDRHFQCPCGRTAWITREDGQVSISCDGCGKTAGGETLTLARENWLLFFSPGTAKALKASPRRR